MTWVPTYTRKGDTLAILMAAYGVSLNEILEQNGLSPMSKMSSTYVASRAKALGLSTSNPNVKKIILENDINEWVYSRGGTCLDFKPGSTTDGRKLAGCTTGGFAVFNDDTEIFLPNKARVGVPARPVKPGEGAPGTLVPVGTSSGIPWWAWALGALGLGLVAKKVLLSGKSTDGSRRRNPGSTAEVDRELKKMGMRRTTGSGWYVTVLVSDPDLGQVPVKVWATDED
jgi:hypothetical protein